MDERGYSQRDLAERLQCAQSTISQLLSGQRRRRDLDVWRNIARLFDRPFAQLMAEAETLYGHLLTDAKRQKGEGQTTGKSADKSQLLSQHAIVKNASEDRLAMGAFLLRIQRVAESVEGVIAPKAESRPGPPERSLAVAKKTL